MVRVLLALTCLAAAFPARAAPLSLGVEATIGGQHLGMTQAPLRNEPLSPMGDLGGTVLVRSGALMIGAAMEGNFDGSTLRRYNASALGGLAADVLPVLRLELLGEYGAANLRSTSDLKQAASGSGTWERFYGFRPGLSAKLPVLPFRVGAWGLARWGMPGSKSGPEYGVLGRIGLEF
jgi:hypothetical protein